MEQKDVLINRANTIINETQYFANDGPRVGGLIKDVVEYADNISQGQVSLGTVANLTELNAIVDPSKGDRYIVSDQINPDNDLPYYYVWSGSAWVNTGSTAFPSDVATRTDLTLKTSRSETFNVSQYNNKYDYASQDAARNAVPTDLRGLGQIVTYKLASGKWVTEQYIGTDLSAWSTTINWIPIKALSMGSYDNIAPIVTDSDDKIILGWDIPNKKLFILNLLKTLEGIIGLDSLDNELLDRINTISEKTDKIEIIQNEEWYIGAIDSDNKIFWGINKDSYMYLFGKKIDSEILGFSYLSDDTWLVAIIDAEYKVIWGIDRDFNSYPDGIIVKDLQLKVSNLETTVAEIKEIVDSGNIGSFNILDVNYIGAFSTLQDLEIKYPITDIRYVSGSDAWEPSILTNENIVGNLDLRNWYASVDGFFAYVRWNGSKHEWFLSDTAIEIKPTIGVRVAIYREVSLGSDFEDVIKQTYLTNNIITSNTLATIKAFEPDVLLVPNAGYTQYKSGIALSTYLNSLNSLLSGITNTLTTILVYSAPNIDAGYNAWISQIKDKCDSFSIKFTDLFSMSGINAVNKNLYALDDATLNAIGAKRISSSFEYNPFRNTQTNKEGIPVIYIDTEDGLFFDNLPKSTKMKMTRFEVDVRNSRLAGFNGTLVPAKDEIRGRGNSTWSMPKKPYRLKFDKKVSFFGLPAEKNWVLLAGYEDKASIRTAIAHNLGHAINKNRLENGEDVWYSPTAQMVELVLNGRYDGLYCFTDHVSKVTSSRIDIPEPAPEDIAILDENLGHYVLNADVYPNVSGGFLVELEADARAIEEMGEPIVDSNNIVIDSTGDVFVRSLYGSSAMRYFACKTLEFYKNDLVTNDAPNGIVLQSYMNYITDFLTETNAVIMGTKDVVNGKTYYQRVSEYIDLDTFIDYFFVQEIAKNNDGQWFSSIHYNKDRDKVVDGNLVKGKLKAGPIWDFAASLGNYANTSGENPEGWWIRDNVWLRELRRPAEMKPYFINRWNRMQLYDKWAKIMDQWIVESYAAAYKDNNRWATSDTKSYLQSTLPFSPTLSDYYEQEVIWLRKWLTERINWINNNINSI